MNKQNLARTGCWGRETGHSTGFWGGGQLIIHFTETVASVHKTDTQYQSLQKRYLFPWAILPLICRTTLPLTSRFTPRWMEGEYNAPDYANRTELSYRHALRFVSVSRFLVDLTLAGTLHHGQRNSTAEYHQMQEPSLQFKRAGNSKELGFITSTFTDSEKSFRICGLRRDNHL